jgi:two-component system nitrate/nitrite sensor histidine kinase NarX
MAVSAITEGYKIPALHALSEIASSLSTDSDVEKLLGRFLSTLIRLAGAKAGAVRVVTSDGEHLRLVSALGLPPEVVERERFVPLGCGVCGMAILDMNTASTESLDTCRERSHAHAFFNEGCQTVIAIPLKHRGKIQGIYNLFLESGRGVPEDVRLLFYSIGEHLGMALENARLTRINTRTALISERQMLANQVHDSLAQTLAYAKMRMSVLKQAVKKGDIGATDKFLGDVDEALDAAYAELRGLITQFRDRMDTRGLSQALEEMIAGFEKRSEIPVELRNLAPDINLAPEQELQVFHIVQEALSNIGKHARATRVVVSIVRLPGCYVFTVSDDGVGHGTSGPGMGFGMNIMRERAEKLGGNLAVENSPGAGLTVRLTLPTPESVQ